MQSGHVKVVTTAGHKGTLPVLVSEHGVPCYEVGRKSEKAMTCAQCVVVTCYNTGTTAHRPQGRMNLI